MNDAIHEPVTPGEVLLEEFLKPADISQYRLAKAAGIQLSRINQIVLGNRTITADTALRLGKALGTTSLFWLNLQNRYDLDTAQLTDQGQLAMVERLLPAS